MKVKNPNAVVTGGTTGIGTLIVFLLGHFHVAVSAEEGALIAGGASAVILFLGREGLGGIWNLLLHGRQAK